MTITEPTPARRLPAWARLDFCAAKAAGLRLAELIRRYRATGGGRVSDSGEGRWTAIAAIGEGVPAPTLASALFARFGSRDHDHFANQVLSAMRNGFGGHAERPAG
jgi:6-phosphogluconate dehydrogenase